MKLNKITIDAIIRPWVQRERELAAVDASTARKQILKKSKALKFVHQIDFAQALSKMKSTIVLLLNRSLEKAGALIEKYEPCSFRQPNPFALAENSQEDTGLNNNGSRSNTRQLVKETAVILVYRLRDL